MKVNLRWLEERDVDQMVDLCLAQAKELKPRFMVYPEVIKAQLQLALERRVFSIIVAEDEGRIVGYCSFMMTTLWGTPLRVFSQEHLYVAESHRGTIVAWRLMRGFVEYALMQEDVAEIYAGVNHGMGDVKRVSQFYEKNGFVQVGAVHRFEASRAIN